MEETKWGFTAEQLLTIARLKEILLKMEEQEIDISSVKYYEAIIFQDEKGKPYISII